MSWICFRARKGAVLSHSVVSDSLWPQGWEPARLLGQWGFPSQEYWSGFPFPTPGGLPHPGIKPGSPTLQKDSLPSEPMETQEKDRCFILLFLKPELKLKRNLLTTFSIAPIDICTYCKYGGRKNTVKNIQILPNSKTLETYHKRKSLYQLPLNCMIKRERVGWFGRMTF